MRWCSKCGSRLEKKNEVFIGDISYKCSVCGHFMDFKNKMVVRDQILAWEIQRRWQEKGNEKKFSKI